MMRPSVSHVHRKQEAPWADHTQKCADDHDREWRRRRNYDDPSPGDRSPKEKAHEKCQDVRQPKIDEQHVLHPTYYPNRNALAHRGRWLRATTDIVAQTIEIRMRAEGPAGNADRPLKREGLDSESGI